MGLVELMLAMGAFVGGMYAWQASISYFGQHDVRGGIAIPMAVGMATIAAAIGFVARGTWHVMKSLFPEPEQARVSEEEKPDLQVPCF